MNDKLKNEILSLIDMKREGGYWDYKEKYHSDNAKLLHDIICLANNLVNRDAYLIFGVSDGGDIKGVSDDKNRKCQADIVDMIRSKKFAGGIFPFVQLETFIIENKEIDVLIIYQSNQVPYYLEDRCVFGKTHLSTGSIYTRRQDTNTPINSTASIYETELLWKRRFGLDLLPFEKLIDCIKDKYEWESNSIGRYYKLFPEFTFVEVDGSEDKNRDVFYAHTQMNAKHYFKKYQFRYHQTILYEGEMVVMDSGRYSTSTPQCEYLDRFEATKENVFYRYFTKDSIEWMIHKFLFNSDDSEEKSSRRRFLEVVLIFKNNYEREKFNKYLERNLTNADLENLEQPIIFKDDSRVDAINNYEIKMAEFFNKKLQEFRNRTKDK